MISEKVAKGAIFLGGAQLLAKILDLLGVIILAAFLMPEDYGIVALSVSLILIASVITELPVGEVLIQKELLEEGDIDTAFTLSIIRGLFLAALLFIAAPVMANLFQDNRIIPIVYLLSASPVAQSLISPNMVKFQRALKYSPIASAQLAGKIIAFCGSIMVALMTHSYWALVVGITAGPVIVTIISYFLAPYSPRFRLKRVPAFLSFAGWVTASRIVWTLNMQADRFFISGILGKSSLGYYTVGSDIASASYALANPLAQTLFAGFSRVSANRERLAAAYLRGQQVMVAVLFPLGVGLAAVAGLFVHLFMGDKWLPIVPIIAWVAPVVALQMMTVAVQALVMATGNTRALLWREIFMLGIRLPLVCGAAYVFGLYEAAAARSISGAIIIWMNLAIAGRILNLKISEQIIGCWRSLLSTGIMAAFVYGAGFYLPETDSRLEEAYTLLGSIVLGVIVYVYAHISIWKLRGSPSGAETFLVSQFKQLSQQAGRIFKRAAPQSHT